MASEVAGKVPAVIARLAVASTVCVLASVAAAAPNIVLILTDDQGWSQSSVAMDDSVEEAHSSYLETPNITRLANAGMRFASGYAPAPLCTPTRRSILGGTSAARSGPEFRSTWVPKDHMTIPTALEGADPDYRSAHFGKWGAQMNSTPEESGYDESDGATNNVTGGTPLSLGENSKSHDLGPPHFIDNEDPKLTASITTRAIDFMRRQSRNDKPFFVQVSYYAQHLSVVTRAETLAKYEAKGTPDRGYPPAWAAMMEELDRGIGRLIDAVDELNDSRETYIFFTSDNGGRAAIPGGSAARAATNAPLSGAKHSLYEGGIRVPFVVRGPGIAAGSVCRSPVVGYDFLPTFVDIAGGNTAELPQEIDGVSIRSWLADPACATAQRKRDAIVFHRPERLFSAVRDEAHKLLVFWKPDGSVDHRELYDVATHPSEEGRDIAAQQPAMADALQAKLFAHLEAVGADKPTSSK